MAQSTILFLAATEDPDADATAPATRLASTRYRATIPYHAIRARGRLVEIAPIGRALSRGFTVGTIVVPQIKETTLRSAPAVAPALLDFVARHRAAGTRIVLDVTDLKFGPDYEVARSA
ncbi:MAG: hypothetical protein FJX67_00070 [Alphaproteobacteria bacterium]|nr:hypothetical protein [Alphaproteobacteria bacterium]